MIKKLILITLLSVGAGFSSFASHIMGGTLAYKDLGTSGGQRRYLVTLKLYRDSVNANAGTELPSTLEIGVYQDDPFVINQKNLFTSFLFNRKNYQTIILPPPPKCPGLLPPPGIVVQQGIYEDTISLPVSSKGYYLFYENYARNSSQIINLKSGIDQGLLWHTYIPPSNVQNSSPYFAQAPFPFFCVGSFENLNNTAIDPDGDSLVYSLINPYNSSNGVTSANPPPQSDYTFPLDLVTYNSGFSYLNPFGAGGSVSINQQNGITTYFSPNLGNYVVAIQVAEYRNGILLSTVIRDMQIVVTSCSGNPRPDIDPITTSQSMIIEEGDTACFAIDFKDPNGDSLSVTYSGELFDLGFIPAPLVTGNNDGLGEIKNTLCWNAICGTSRVLPYKFKALIRDNGCPPITVSIDFTVEVKKPKPVIAGSFSVCQDEVSAYTVAQRPGSKYKWVVINGTIPSDTGNAINVTWGTGAGMIKLVETNQYGCKSDTSFQAVQIFNKPIVTITGNSSICKNQSTQLVANAPGTITYQWSGGIITAGSTINITPDSTKVYTVIANDGKCTSNPVSQTVTVHQPPIITITALDDSICIGSSTTLIGAGGVSYSWIFKTSPADTLARTQGLLADTTITSDYILIGKDIYGCINKDTVKITVLPLPIISVVASRSVICPEDLIRLSGVGAYSYKWANKKTPGIFLSSDSVFFDSPTDTLTYILTGTDIHGCVDTTEKLIIVNPNPVDFSIFGPPYICPQSLNIPYYPTTPDPLSTYSWAIGSGSSIASQNRDTVKINFGNPGSVTITGQETNQYGCKGNISSYNVEIIEIYTPPAPEGPTAVCSNDFKGVAYNTPFNNPGSQYIWHVIGGNVSGPNGTSNVSIDWNTTGVKAGKIWYEEISNCHWVSDTLEVDLYQSPTTGNISGRAGSCIESSGIYSVNSSNTSTYNWTLSSGGSIISGQGTRFIQVNWTTAGTHHLTIEETSVDGCPGFVVPLDVTISTPPSLSPAGLVGDLTVCPSSSSGRTYSLANSNATSKYHWQIQGGEIISGNGTDSITVDWDFLTNIHNISVSEENKDSCLSNGITKTIVLDGAEPEMISVSVNPKDNAEININWKVSYKLGKLNTYNLYRRLYNSTDTNNTWQLIAENYLGTTYNDKSILTRKSSYQYRYSIVDFCGGLSFSVAQNSILLKAEADKKENIINLSWNKYNNWASGVDKYEIWRKLDGEIEYHFYKEAGLDTFFTAQNGTEGFEHCYKIKAVGINSNNISWSNDTCVDFSNIVNIPSAFSPNGDGVNDTWVIKNIEAYKNSSIEVFNRWGETVFRAKSYNNNWGGTDGGKPLPKGTYYYVIKLNNLITDQKKSFSGTVSILK